MRTVAIVVVAVGLFGLEPGVAPRSPRRGSTLADRVRFTSHFLLRAYVAVIFGWSAVVLPRQHDRDAIVPQPRCLRGGVVPANERRALAQVRRMMTVFRGSTP